MTAIILDQPDQIKFARLATLKAALKLECLGMKMSRGTSAYAMLKRDYGYKGNKAKVLAQVTDDVELAIMRKNVNAT